MIAVLFEIELTEAGRAAYLEAAASLQVALAAAEGLLSIERFQSLNDAGRLLSLSVWRDEQAVEAWRNQPAHRLMQAKGRTHWFADYRLRVAHVVRDYGKFDRNSAPPDSRAAHGQGGD
jgi:heme-degrading monooxygenase HmoA